jgi:hypothetical protein
MPNPIQEYMTLDDAISELENGNTNSPQFWESVNYAIAVLKALKGET